MRSSGATYWGFFFSVVVLTKLKITCFAGPSFQDGNGSAPVSFSTALCTAPAGVEEGESVEVGVVDVGVVAQPVTMSARKTARIKFDFPFRFIKCPPTQILSKQETKMLLVSHKVVNHFIRE